MPLFFYFNLSLLSLNFLY